MENTKQNCYYGLMRLMGDCPVWEKVRFPERKDAIDWGMNADQKIVIMPWGVARDAKQQNWPIYRR